MAIVYGVVQNCDTGNVLPYSSISDSFGNYATTDVNGLWYSTVAYPGYVVTASHGGYYTKSHTVTENEIKMAWVTICLDPKPPTTSCFTADTHILMADGSEKVISRVEVGELVMGTEGNVSCVSSIEQPVLGNRLLHSLNGSEYFVTDEHPFMTNEGWKAINPLATAEEIPNLYVARLMIGDLVKRVVSVKECVMSGYQTSVMKDNLVPTMSNRVALADVLIESTLLKSLKTKQAEAMTILYNLQLEGGHEYFANGFLVHNKGGGW